MLLLQEEWRENKVEAHGEMLSPHHLRAPNVDPPSSAVAGAGAWAWQQLVLVSSVSAQ